MADSAAPGVHEVMDHVRQNLGRGLPLAELATVAHFSPHHFHRLFKGATGETVSAYVRRARLERAVRLMQGSPDRTLSSIAAEVGFATPSDFARVFRAHYGQTPSSWDRRSPLAAPSPRTGIDRAPAPAPATAPGTAPGPDDERPVSVVERPAARLAYVRVRDPWRGDNLAAGYHRLTDWLSGRGVGPSAGELVGLSWESAKATPIERLSYDLAVTVGPGVDADLPAIKRFRRRPRVLDATAWDVDCSIALRPRWP